VEGNRGVSVRRDISDLLSDPLLKTAPCDKYVLSGDSQGIVIGDSIKTDAYLPAGRIGPPRVTRGAR